MGDPEGVVVAPPGTLYLNTAPVPPGTNQTMFIKVSGVGNTGWDRAVLIDRTSGQVFIGQDVTDHGSNAGLQYTSLVANRAQLRTNQYGPNTGVPGSTGFKSRGPIGGPDVGLVDGDVMWRATGIGIAPNDASFPLTATVTEQVPLPLAATTRVAARQGGAVIPNNWLGSEFEVALVSVFGPINSRRIVALCDSEGVLETLRGVRAGGPAVAASAQGLAEGATWSSGAGDPNGVVTGNVGDLWSRTDGGAGTSLYVKEAGNKTTAGWVGK